jgi:hypothetical protein
VSHGTRRQKSVWIELVLASFSALMFLITFVWRDWIELIFNVDPDRGSGLLEWAIVASLGAATIGTGLLARAEWRRTQPT